jgi:NitT/TauT family transport system ATP-binding protein
VNVFNLNHFPTSPLIHLRDIGKRYCNGTIALRGVDLDVGEHQFVSLLGPSGCGKTAVLRIIAGLGRPTAGTLKWPGASNPEIGFVFQEPTLMPWATVFDNVYLPLKLKGQSRANCAVHIDDALATVGLDRFRDSYPRELSGGMKMRVSIARAMVTQPAVLLMDEPFAALDEITRLKLNNEFLDLWARHTFTVIFVTHSVYESVYLSNRIVVMAARPGRVIDDIAIDAPYPRTDEFRLSEAYTSTCRTVSASLHRAMTSGGETENAQ